MKKRILAILLSALLVANVSACNFVPQNEIEETFENIDTAESTQKEIEKTTAGITEETSTNKPEENVDVGNVKKSDFSYTVNEDGTVTIKHYYGNDCALVLPEYIDGKPVTEIGDYAFGGVYNSKLESVTLNNTLVKIGDNAFEGCANLKKLIIPESVKSGGYNLHLCDSIETIYGKKGSFAETCAAKNSIDFVDLETGYAREYSKGPVNPLTLDYFACKQIGGYNTFRDESEVQHAEALFGYDRYEQCYTHVPAWDAYFQVPIPKYEVPVDALISRDYLLVISAVPDGTHVTTYKFSKDGILVESYDIEFSLSYCTRDYDEAWLYNWYQEDLLYAFFLENTMKTSEHTDYVMHKFQSTDCGKTWTQVEESRLDLVHVNIDMFKMFTNDHGAIVNAGGGEGDIYVTHDGGGIWSQLELPYPAEWGELEGFLLKSITYEDNKYVIVLWPYSQKAPSQEITFVSKDFVNWEIKEYY